MKYDWEADALDLLHELFQKISSDPSYANNNFRVVGMAVENEETGEGAYLSLEENDGSLILSDVMSDILGDVKRFYNATIDNRKW